MNRYIYLACLLLVASSDHALKAQSTEDSEEKQWQSYFEKSEVLAAADRHALALELEELGLEKAALVPKSRSWNYNADVEDLWFDSVEASSLIANLLSFQCPNGGWSKSIDFTTQHREPGMRFASEKKWVATIDNHATTSQIQLLARAYRLSNKQQYSDSCKRGIQYLLAAQYPNGGWPQVYPLIGGYHDHITFNDQAMVNVLFLLRQIANDDPDFAWLDNETKSQVRAAFEKGIECVLDTQFKINGVPTAWCQQHDARTLEPKPARAYEMVSLSSAESSEILDLLISIEQPNQRTIDAIRTTIDWLEKTAIDGYSYERQDDGARALVQSENGERVWARFYEIQSNRPLFGDRNQSVHYELSEISFERRRGYSWYTTSPESTLKRALKWEAKIQKKSEQAPPEDLIVDTSFLRFENKASTALVNAPSPVSKK